jgi:predicted permease
MLFSTLSLDLKVGLRMLVKCPGLTLVGVLGMSVAVAVGTLAFTAAEALTGGTLPFDPQHRVVTITNFDTRGGTDGRRTHLHDLATWREGVHTIEALGAYRTVARNFIAPNSLPGEMLVAEMSASAFRTVGVAPLRGRVVSGEDEQAGAPNVVLIGYDLWKQRLGGREGIVGSTVQLGAVRHTVIGVMPNGFAFPLNHQLWVPLRLSPLAYPRGEAPAIEVFGRLARGLSLDDARRELTTIGQRLAAENPKTHAYMRPSVFLFTRTFIDRMVIQGTQAGSLVHLGQVIVILLLSVIATNVGVLVYARTASRSAEMAIRTALGASRRRIVTQLFAEALVLSSVASVVGTFVAYFAFARVEANAKQVAGNFFPYWVQLQLTPGVVTYVVALAMFAAVVIGVIPGLKATQHRVYENLKDLSGGSLKLGRTWTALLVAQVAVSVSALPLVLAGSVYWVQSITLDRDTPVTEESLIAMPFLDAPIVSSTVPVEDVQTRRTRYTNRVTELAQKLRAEPGGFEVVLMSAVPGAEPGQPFETDHSTSDSATRENRYAGTGYVDAEFFSTFGVRILAGRSFTAADLAHGAPGVIVDRTFADQFFGGGSALGRRVRPAPRTGAGPETQPWWQIVGVVDVFPPLRTGQSARPRVYVPLQPTNVGWLVSNDIYPLILGVRTRSLDPLAAADRARLAAVDVDPTLRFASIQTLAAMMNKETGAQRMALFALVMVSSSVVLLAAAGIYALMSFTVNRRRREIGIRTALGAGRWRVLADILSKAMWQIGIGIVIGLVGSSILRPLLGNSSTYRELLVYSLEVTLLMGLVSALATLGPARRALSVQPTETLRAE